MKLILVTATGDRPEAFKLCERWMAAQDQSLIHEWIVLDDGITPTSYTAGQTYIRCPEFRGQQSLNKKMGYLSGVLANVRGRLGVVFIEDDDFYHYHYLTTCSCLLELNDVIGETNARYYNVNCRRYHEHGNTEHASLCQTAIRLSAFPTLMERALSMTNGAFIDMSLWQQARQFNTIRLSRPDPATWGNQRMVIGIKGMPGRNGYGMGHRPSSIYKHDPDATVLKQWVGEEAAAIYMKYHNNHEQTY